MFCRHKLYNHIQRPWIEYQGKNRQESRSIQHNTRWFSSVFIVQSCSDKNTIKLYKWRFVSFIRLFSAQTFLLLNNIHYNYSVLYFCLRVFHWVLIYNINKIQSIFKDTEFPVIDTKFYEMNETHLRLLKSQEQSLTN